MREGRPLDQLDHVGRLAHPNLDLLWLGADRSGGVDSQNCVRKILVQAGCLGRIANGGCRLQQDSAQRGLVGMCIAIDDRAQLLDRYPYLGSHHGSRLPRYFRANPSATKISPTSCPSTVIVASVRL